MWGSSEIIAVTGVASLRRCPTSPESVPHFSGICIFIESAGRTQRRWEELLGLRPDIPQYEQLSPHPFATPPPEPRSTTTSPAPLPSTIPPTTGQAPTP